MRADRTGGPVEQSRYAAGWRSASETAGRRDVVRCHQCQHAVRQADTSASTAGTRWRCARGQWATSAYATCALARHRDEPAREEGTP